MEKGRKKGRPPISPYVTAYIKARVDAEQIKTPEKRAPIKTLAFNVQRELIDGRVPGEKIPKLSTIEKKVLEFRRDMTENKPWNLDTLRDPVNRIPPQALEKVFKIWLAREKDPGSPPLTVREARWIAQLSGMTEDTELLRRVAERCALREMVGDLSKISQLSWPAITLEIYADLINMPLDTKLEHYEAMVREKHVDDSWPGYVMDNLRAIYDPEFFEIMGMKLGPKEEKDDSTRKPKIAKRKREGGD